MDTKLNARDLVIVDAPSNLGLSPPAVGSVPGCYKLGWALREAGLTEGLRARDGGVVVPPRYEARWEPGEGVRNAEGIASFSMALADRISRFHDEGAFVLVLGGDCSVLLGAALALAEQGRHGLAFLDGHTDFRHPGNSSAVGAVAGEDLAIVTGRGDSRLISLRGLGPYFHDADIVAIGMRASDEYLEEIRGLGISAWPVERIRNTGIGGVLAELETELGAAAGNGYWIHLDVDILDPSVVPAVDTPDPGGLYSDELSTLVGSLASNPNALGMDVCILDPDLDPQGVYAREVVAILKPALEAVGAR